MLSALDGFLRDENPSRPLVMSFHGQTGTGKNHVARLIAESIYRKGMDSQYVHLKVPLRDYPHKNELEKYKDDLQNELRRSASCNKRKLFIFDEVEDLPQGLLDAIKPYIDYHKTLDGMDFSKSIFIFLSNIGGREITKELIDHGSTRESLRLLDFEQAISKAAFNQKAGFHRSRLIDSHLVSHFIPFLPLERKHVKRCIHVETFKFGIPSLAEETIADILDELPFGVNETEKYAVKGCKNVREKVNLHVYKQYYKDKGEL